MGEDIILAFVVCKINNKPILDEKWGFE